MFVRPGPRFTEEELRQAVAASLSWAETLRRLGYRTAGGNWRTLQKYAALWDVPTAHFDPDTARNNASRRAHRGRTPLAEILVMDSTYSRAHLKDRLFAERVKERRCELCGQDENWRGRRMALILDHINGTPDDNRLENLRIVCPNCAATFETHCARKNRIALVSISCRHCGRAFVPKRRKQRYCSRECGSRWSRAGVAKPEARRVERPPYPVLLGEIERDGYAATGRKYGVSDNAIRKWVRFYENQRT
jgi:transposase-like protein